MRGRGPGVLLGTAGATAAALPSPARVRAGAAGGRVGLAFRRRSCASFAGMLVASMRLAFGLCERGSLRRDGRSGVSAFLELLDAHRGAHLRGREDATRVIGNGSELEKLE
jgi:hypothetical protein